MSHFPVLVIMPDEITTIDDPAILEKTTELLAPYDEDGTWFRDAEGEDEKDSRWDWWVVGGRWTGSLDGYDPEADPENLQECDLCNGTGTRPLYVTTDKEGKEVIRWDPKSDWAEKCGGCNGCGGKGQSVKWPTQWKHHDGDIQPAQSIIPRLLEFLPSAIVTPDGEWHEKGRVGWFGVTLEENMPEADWNVEVAKLLTQYGQAPTVLVDCHV